MMTTVAARGPQPVTLTVTNAKGEITAEQTFFNSRVNTGAQAMLNQMFGNGVQPASFQYVALSTATTNPVSASDTAAIFTSNGEIAASNFTGGNRQLGTFAYQTAPGSLNANATGKISATWTASQSGTIGTIGLLNNTLANNATAVLGLETVLTTPVTYNATDTIALSWTLNQ